MANERYSNPGRDRRKFKILEERVQKLEGIVDQFVKDKLGVAPDLVKAKAKTLEDLKIAELKVLCEENGVDYSEFPNSKPPFIKALQDKGLK